MEISIKRTPKNTGKDANASTEELLDLINAAAFMSEALDERITLIGRICEDEINKINTKIEKVVELLADTAMTQGQKEIIIKGIKSILLFFKSLNAGANCPQREPNTVISSITIGAKLSSLPDATVLLRTKVPLGLVNDIEVSKPEAVPVASTTTSYIFSGLNSFNNRVSTP